MTERPRIILDCDPGVDDAMAIITASLWTDLVALTTVSGNVNVQHTTENALRIRNLLKMPVPIHRGADRPLAAKPVDARHVHGTTGLADIDLPLGDSEPDSINAVEAIVELTRLEEGLHLVPIGPLTNIALAIQLDPKIVQRIASITLMGGSARGGNVTAAAEFNIFADVEAADEVFKSGAPLKMVGLNLTQQLQMERSHVEVCRSFDHPVGEVAARLIEYNLSVPRGDGLSGSGVMHDPCAVLAVSHPHLIKSEPRQVVIEVDGKHTRGQTLVDERSKNTKDFNCQVAYTIETDKALALILQAVCETG